jgi:hypothetical protein
VPRRPALSSARTTALAIAVMAIVVFVPVVVALIAINRPQWYPTGDMAQAELHVRGFWSHPPLVGAAGRIQNADGVQGSHPGPGLWLAMWPLYALLGSTSLALTVSVVCVHLVTFAAALWLAWRRGGALLAACVAAGVAFAVRAGGPDMLTEPWNPWMALLPFLVFVLLLAYLLEGELWALPAAVVAGSYSIQAHAGYVIVVVGLLGFATIAAVRAEWRGDRRRLAAWGAVAAGAGFLVWLPPLIDQVRRDPGNVSILIDNFGNPDEPYLGLADVAEIVVVQLNLLGPWVFGPGRDSFGAVAAIGFAAMVLLWVAAVRSAWIRRAAGELRMHALLAVAWVLAAVSIARIFGTYFEYTVRWLWMLDVLVVAASLWSLSQGWQRRLRTVAAAAAIVPLTVLAVATAQFATRAGPTGARDSRIVGGLVPEVVDDLDRSARYLLRWWDPAALGATGFGAVLELERRGFTVGVDAQFAAAALPHRVQPEQSATAVLYLVIGEESITRARELRGLEELGGFEPRDADGQRRSRELRAEIERRMAAGGQADRIALLDAFYGQAQLLFNEPPPPPGVRELLGEYIDLRQPAVMFRAPPGTPVLPL